MSDSDSDAFQSADEGSDDDVPSQVAARQVSRRKSGQDRLSTSSSAGEGGHRTTFAEPKLTKTQLQPSSTQGVPEAVVSKKPFSAGEICESKTIVPEVEGKKGRGDVGDELLRCPVAASAPTQVIANASPPFASKPSEDVLVEEERASPPNKPAKKLQDQGNVQPSGPKKFTPEPASSTQPSSDKTPAEKKGTVAKAPKVSKLGMKKPATGAKGAKSTKGVRDSPVFHAAGDLGELSLDEKPLPESSESMKNVDEEEIEKVRHRV